MPVPTNRLMHSRLRYLLPTLLLLLLLAACGGNEPEPTAVPPAEPAEATETVVPAEEAAPTETAVPEAETDSAETAPADTPTEAPAEEAAILNVGINLEFRPFVYRDENGNLAGFDIDLINALAAAGNFEIAYVETPFDGIFARLNAGEYDVVISAITVTDARQEIVDFTNVYFQSGQAVVSYFNAGQGLATRADDSTIVGVESLDSSKRVAVKEGTTGDIFVTEQTEAEVVRYADANLAIAALIGGETDAAVVDIAVLAKAISDSGQLKLVGPPVTEEEYAMAVAEGDSATLERLNTALAEIRQSGVYDQLVQRWFGAP